MVSDDMERESFYTLPPDPLSDRIFYREVISAGRRGGYIIRGANAPLVNSPWGIDKSIIAKRFLSVKITKG
jgi:phosphosulfolactate phosphohydrolase-like enzyme